MSVKYRAKQTSDIISRLGEDPEKKEGGTELCLDLKYCLRNLHTLLGAEQLLDCLSSSPCFAIQD